MSLDLANYEKKTRKAVRHFWKQRESASSKNSSSTKRDQGERGAVINNFNNRTEEALGTAVDIWTAYREGAFGHGAPQPFVGWLMLLEDAEGATRPSRLESSPHFNLFPEFVKASYSRRYELLCQKLVREQHYTAAALLLSPREKGSSGSYRELSEDTGIKAFLGRIAAFAAAEAIK